MKNLFFISSLSILLIISCMSRHEKISLDMQRKMPESTIGIYNDVARLLLQNKNSCPTPKKYNREEFKQAFLNLSAITEKDEQPFSKLYVFDYILKKKNPKAQLVFIYKTSCWKKCRKTQYDMYEIRTSLWKKRFYVQKLGFNISCKKPKGAEIDEKLLPR